MDKLQYAKLLHEARRKGENITLTFLGPDDSLVVEDAKNPVGDSETDIPAKDRVLLDYKTAAKLLSITTQALRDLVYKNKGPAVCQVGKRTYFTYDDLIAYSNKHRIPAPVSQDISPLKRQRGRPRVVGS